MGSSVLGRVGTHPRVFGKSAEGIERKELGGKNVVYGKWKSAQVEGRKGDAGGIEGVAPRRAGRVRHGGETCDEIERPLGAALLGVRIPLRMRRKVRVGP